MTMMSGRQKWLLRQASLFLLVAMILLATAWGEGNIAASGVPAARRNARKAESAESAGRTKTRADVARFQARVDAALSDAHAQKALWGVLVEDRDTGEVLYELHADRFFAPASNAKLFVSSLALATLGPDYKIRTTLESNGTLSDDGRLSGDLILVGRGDPDLSNRAFPYTGKAEHDGPVEKILAELADGAVAKGLREVDGDIVADDSYFPYDPYPAGWSAGDLFFSYGAPVSAIDFNDNTVTLQVQPGANAGDPPIVTTEPAAAADEITQEMSTAASSVKPDFAVVDQPGPDFILLRGIIPVGHAPIDLDFAMTHPAETAARALKQLLEARGVRVTGRVRVVHAPPPDTSEAGDLPPRVAVTTAARTGANSLVLAEHDSPPLLESVRLMNKVSQNLHAELLLRTVGREKAGLGTAEAGLKVEQDFVKAAGVQDGDVVLEDGSGLSRGDLVTPRAVVALLRYDARQPWGEEFISSLPIAGVDGTLDSRMKSTAAAGLIQAKTGALEHDRALSGYAATLRGEHLVFSIFGNNNPEHGHDATEAIDAIGVAMVETLGPERKAKKKKK
jgi:serine-type D-Ala-D-Ala carboxypeptidase/endopeptidase (penicillin-binding protein 4)